MGTILPYVGNLDKIPKKWHLCDGTEGTPNLLDGRFLEGSTTVGIFKEAGLPNLQGRFTFIAYSGHSAEGVFIKVQNLINGMWNGPSEGGEASMYFNASRYSSIYKDSCDTVQPAAYTVYYIMKIKN